MAIKALILLIAAIGSVNGAFPEDPKPCKYGDVECIGKIYNYFIGEKHAGDDNIGLTSIDPLPINKIQVSRGEDSPVNIQCSVANGEATGIKTMKFIKMKGFGKDIAVPHEITSKAEYFRLTGDYNITGKVLILPIQGSGRCNITMYEPTFTMGWTGVPYEKDGATYMKLDKFYIDMNPKRMSFYFDNLYNDKALSDNMNKFLTENWGDIFPELRSPMNHGVGLIIRKIMMKIFAKFPYEKLFQP